MKCERDANEMCSNSDCSQHIGSCEDQSQGVIRVTALISYSGTRCSFNIWVHVTYPQITGVHFDRVFAFEY